MIQKSTIIKPSDNSGVLKTNVFHIYKGSYCRLAYSGDFLKVSAREVIPENIVKKKSKHKSIIIRTKFKNFKRDGSYVNFEENSIILLKKRLTPRGKLIKGSVSRLIRRKKFLSSFKKSI